VGVSSGNWFEGSQVSKARPGAPFDFILRYCRDHMPCHFSGNLPQASRLLPRHAGAGGMTKGRFVVSWKVVAGQKEFFITFGGPQAHDSCGFLLAQTLKPYLPIASTFGFPQPVKFDVTRQTSRMSGCRGPNGCPAYGSHCPKGRQSRSQNGGGSMPSARRYTYPWPR
jgi:hypothetical protein